MRIMFCWRCRMDMPMLDEEEFAVIPELYSEGIRATKEFRQKHDLPPEQCPIKERFRPLLRKYEEMTGFNETNAAAIMHHRIAQYGSVCQHCNKPLRSPKTNWCAACGKDRD